MKFKYLLWLAGFVVSTSSVAIAQPLPSVKSGAVSIPLSELIQVSPPSNKTLGTSPTPNAGVIQNEIGADETITQTTLHFSDGSSTANGTCLGESLGISATITGSLSFPNGSSISLNSTAAYTLAQNYATGGATAVTCIAIQIFNGTGLLLTAAALAPGFSETCNTETQTCTATSGTMIVTQVN